MSEMMASLPPLPPHQWPLLIHNAMQETALGMHHKAIDQEGDNKTAMNKGVHPRSHPL